MTCNFLTITFKMDSNFSWIGPVRQSWCWCCTDWSQKTGVQTADRHRKTEKPLSRDVLDARQKGSRDEWNETEGRNLKFGGRNLGLRLHQTMIFIFSKSFDHKLQTTVRSSQSILICLAALCGQALFKGSLSQCFPWVPTVWRAVIHSFPHRSLIMTLKIFSKASLTLT